MPRLRITLEPPPNRETVPPALMVVEVFPIAPPDVRPADQRPLRGPWFPAFDDSSSYEPVI